MQVGESSRPLLFDSSTSAFNLRFQSVAKNSSRSSRSLARMGWMQMQASVRELAGLSWSFNWVLPFPIKSPVCLPACRHPCPQSSPAARPSHACTNLYCIEYIQSILYCTVYQSSGTSHVVQAISIWATRFLTLIYRYFMLFLYLFSR